MLLVGCNANADVPQLMNQLAKHCENQETLTIRSELSACRGFPAFQVGPTHSRSMLKNRLFVVGSSQEPQQLMDLAKCADIICPVISVQAADPQRITQDPFNYAGAFDESGYAVINLLRSLSLPRVVGLMQHLE